jgi:hypothetical protein
MYKVARLGRMGSMSFLRIIDDAVSSPVTSSVLSAGRLENRARSGPTKTALEGVWRSMGPSSLCQRT